MSARLSLLDDLPNHGPEQLTESEAYWRDHQPWLASCGYMLRPRYTPNWKPSWEGTKKNYLDCEDGSASDNPTLLDATRISDGKFVFLKIISKSVHPYEAEIGLFFSSEAMASDPRNHCVPFHEILQVPDDGDKLILVMPLLREYYDPRFDTVGEVVDFFRQVFEGLQFMHQHHVAHRDCMHLNIMMDAGPLFPKPYHPTDNSRLRDFSDNGWFPSGPKHYTRTQRPVKYYLTDFGISRRYNPDDGPPLEDPILGGDKTVPEFQASLDACNPFPTDVYYIGNMIRKTFLVGTPYFHTAKLGLEFIEPLIADMVQDDPTKRPNMDEVVAEFEVIRKGLSTSKLRSRLVERNENPIVGFFRSIAACLRRMKYVIRRIPPVPTPPP